MRLSHEKRSLVADARKRGIKTSRIAEVFGVSLTTIKRWIKRKRFSDKKRRPKESKITLKVELAILAMRNLFKWGTARIQQGLMCLPGYAKEVLVNTVENVRLSRTTINHVLSAHKLNGYLNESKHWKFFRAQKPDELWQLDIKGPFIVQGKKYFFVICIDDYSRYMLLAEQLDHSPTVREITVILEQITGHHKPKKILTDNNPFRDEWNQWCEETGIEALHAHPYYPQDKGKVERAIRNITEEFINLIRKFPGWLEGKINDYKTWFNNSRFHRGINTVPSALYGTLET